MSKPQRWHKILVVVGAVGLAVGTIDPLEGSVLILAGVLLIAVGGLAGGRRHRRLLVWSLLLTLVGVAAMWILSLLGGVGGSTGLSAWWLLPSVAPYALGWLLAVIGTVLVLREFFGKRRAVENGSNQGPRASPGVQFGPRDSRPSKALIAESTKPCAAG